jgi:hypothetical protein
MSARVITLHRGFAFHPLHADGLREFVVIRIDAEGKRHEKTIWAKTVGHAEDAAIEQHMQEGDRYLHVRELRP